MTAVGGVTPLRAGAGVGLMVGARTIATLGAPEIQALDIRPLGDVGRRLAATALGGMSLTGPNDGSSRATP